MYQQAQYTPFSPGPGFDQKTDIDIGKSGIIGGLIKSYLGSITGGIVGGGGEAQAGAAQQAPSSGQMLGANAMPQQSQQQQGLGNFVQNLDNNFQQAYQAANQNSQLGQIYSNVGQQTGWWE